MSLVGVLIDVMGPVLLVAGIGAIVGPRLDLEPGSLSRVAYWLLGPAFVFNLFVTTDVVPSVVVRLAAAAVAGMAAAAATVVVVGPRCGLGGRRLRATVMTGGFGNVGNAGLAVTAFALGEEALALAGVLMLAVNIVGITTGVALSAGSGVGVGAAVLRALASPMPLAAAGALAVRTVGVDLPLAVSRAVGLLAEAMIPVMLLTLGLQLATSGRTGGVSPVPSIAVTSVAKLAVAPAVAGLVATSVGLTGDAAAAAVIQSAMPPAVFCALVATEYDLEPELVTTTVVATTLLALVTLPVVLLTVT